MQGIGLGFMGNTKNDGVTVSLHVAFRESKGGTKHAKATWARESFFSLEFPTVKERLKKERNMAKCFLLQKKAI